MDTGKGTVGQWKGRCSPISITEVHVFKLNLPPLKAKGPCARKVLHLGECHHCVPLQAWYLPDTRNTMPAPTPYMNRCLFFWSLLLLLSLLTCCSFSTHLSLIHPQTLPQSGHLDVSGIGLLRGSLRPPLSPFPFLCLGTGSVWALASWAFLPPLHWVSIPCFLDLLFPFCSGVEL